MAENNLQNAETPLISIKSVHLTITYNSIKLCARHKSK